MLLKTMTIKQEKEKKDLEDGVEEEEEEDDDNVVGVAAAAASISILEMTTCRQKRDGTERFVSFPAFSKWTSFLLSATYNTARLHELRTST
jgi:hypothetical protein